MSLVPLPLIALLVALAGAELTARLWLRIRRRYYVFTPGLRVRSRFVPALFPQLEPLVRFDVNADGERSDEVPRVRRGDCLYRVVVGSGSQGECYMLDQHTTWPAALQRMLSTSTSLRSLNATHVHVGNIARSGVASDSLAVIFDRVLPRYPRLQLIVIVVGTSNVQRWLEQGAPSAPPPPSSTSDFFMCHPEGPFAWLPPQLALVELLRRLRHAWLRPVTVEEPTGRWMLRARAMRAEATDMRTVVPDPAPMLDHFEIHLRRAVARARAHADRVLVVRQPWFEPPYTTEQAARMWHGSVGRAWRDRVSTYYGFDVFSQLMAALGPRTARVARELGAEYLDPMPWLEPSLDTYFDHVHFTPAGARRFAEIIAAAVLRRPSSLLDDTRASDAAVRLRAVS